MYILLFLSWYIVILEPGKLLLIRWFPGRTFSCHASSGHCTLIGGPHETSSSLGRLHVESSSASILLAGVFLFQYLIAKLVGFICLVSWCIVYYSVCILLVVEFSVGFSLFVKWDLSPKPKSWKPLTLSPMQGSGVPQSEPFGVETSVMGSLAVGCCLPLLAPATLCP